MKYTAVIFDMDGTLLNTLDDLADSVDYTLNLLGYEKRNTDEIKKFLGYGVKKLVQDSMPEGVSNDAVNNATEIFKKHYETNMKNKTCPYKGIKELLNELKKRNVKVGIVSNKFHEALQGLCEENFKGYYKTAIGDSPKRNKKPAPDSVFEAMKQLDAKNDETIYIGDSEVDIRTAKNAFLPSIGVTWGFRDIEVLKQEGADYIIKNPMDIIDIVEGRL